MAARPAATAQVSSLQAINGVRLLGGPLRLVGWSFNDGTATTESTVDQSAAAPAAGATVASISLPNGEYEITWTLELSGTPGAADVDNVQMFNGATLVATSVNAGAVGNYLQATVQINVQFGPLTVAWKAIGAAAVGSVYKVEANIIPVNGSTGKILDGSGAIGFTGIPVGQTETQWFGPDGIAVDTELAVQTTTGLIQGVIWYYLFGDHPEQGEQEPRLE